MDCHQPQVRRRPFFTKDFVMILSMLFTIVSVVGMLFFGHMGWGYTGILKMCASSGFLSMALFAGALDYRYGKAVLVALIFSWFGDLFLIFSADAIFLMGLVAFLLGHIAFALAFVVHGIDKKWSLIAAAVLAIPATIVCIWLTPHLGDMLLPVYAYIIVITLMVAFAFGAVGKGAVWWVVVGAVAFYISDIFVARSRFVTSSPWNGLIGLPLYFGAQVVFAYTVKCMHPRLRND